MRTMCLCVIAISIAISILAVGGTLRGGGDKETGDKELKKIQGTWKFIAQEMDGKESPKEALAKLTITFRGDKWAVRVEDKVVQAGTHQLDGTKKPGQIDAVVTEGEDKGSTMLGIYELSGDKLKVCFDPKGKQRPTSFTSKAGQFAAVVEREKKKE